MVTILDVAREAGVSKSTVSRVLNKSGPVQEKTKTAVEEAIKRLKYSPSYFAQGIRTGKTKTLAMLVPEYANIFYDEMFCGVEDIALKYGYMVLICNTARKPSAEMDYTRALLKRKIDGIIYNTYENNEEMIRFLKETSEHVPVVLMDRVGNMEYSLPYVITDGIKSTQKAVQYLYSRGKRKIGYIRNAKAISVTDDRYEGYLRGMKDCGLEPNPAFVFLGERENTSDYTIQLGRRAAEYYAKLDEKPDALLCAIDMIALGCLKRFKELGIRVPQDVNLIGFDNISLGELYEPALTTIAQPIRELGRAAAQIIINKLNGEPAGNHIIFEGSLIVRETTD